jgi:hypothetical protein
VTDREEAIGVARTGHTASLLSTVRLVAGGVDAPAELYQPAHLPE